MARAKMTEALWLDLLARELPPGRHGQVVEFLEQVSTPRKLRLFACACVRLVPGLPDDARVRRAITTAEDFADARATEADLESVRKHAYEALADYQYQAELLLHPTFGEDDPTVGFVAAACSLVHRDSAPHLANLLRAPFPYRPVLLDVFGNPFAPVRSAPEWLTWNHGLVRSMAQGMYEDRHFADAPILADALAEAGCEVAPLLEHLRQPGGHVRGCWAVDLLRADHP